MLDGLALATGGFALGAALTAMISKWAIGRHLRRERAAERRARAAERLAELGSMTGGLAHEIKNPLSTVGLNAQLLKEGIDSLQIDEADRTRLIRRAESLQREVERLRGILTDFLEFAGQTRLDTAPGDLNQIVDELVDFFLPQAQRVGVRLSARLAPGRLEANLDAPLIKQAVLNLLLNAVQAMDSGDAPGSIPRGELILKTERGSDADGRPTVILHVIDTGPGMEPETIRRLFEPYFTTKSGGTGLGLPTARKLIEHHGGRMEVHSEPGRGTDFTVTLPAG